MLESLNRTVEHSVSWRAIRWRITALTTGKSFAEVVLLNTLVYRVEQILLIDRRSGLLVQHVTSDPRAAEDADMISGMLTAIRDFAHDSFRVSEDEGLEALRVGDCPSGLSRALRHPRRGDPRHAAARTAHRTAGSNRAGARVLRRRAPNLRAGIPARSRTSGQPSRTACSRSTRREPDGRRGCCGRWSGSVSLSLAAWLYFTLQGRARWNGYLNALRAEPGIVVVDGERQGGRYLVRGLRDPLARDPSVAVASAPAERKRRRRELAALSGARSVVRADTRAPAPAAAVHHDAAVQQWSPDRVRKRARRMDPRERANRARLAGCEPLRCQRHDRRERTSDRQRARINCAAVREGLDDAGRRWRATPHDGSRAAAHARRAGAAARTARRDRDPGACRFRWPGRVQRPAEQPPSGPRPRRPVGGRLSIDRSPRHRARHQRTGE